MAKSIPRKPRKDRFKEQIDKIPSPPSAEEAPGRIRRTDEEIKKDKIDVVKKILDEKPDPVLIPLVKMIFNTWPYSVISSIRYDDLMKMAEKSLPLKDEEATAFAMPLTQLKNYYLPGINPIWFAWANLVSAIYSSMSIRLTILRELRELIRVRDKENAPQVCACANPDKIPLDTYNHCTVCHKKRPPKK